MSERAVLRTMFFLYMCIVVGELVEVELLWGWRGGISRYFEEAYFGIASIIWFLAHYIRGVIVI